MQTGHRTVPLIVVAASMRCALITVLCGATARPLVGQIVPSWPIDPIMTAESELNIRTQLGQMTSPPPVGLTIRSMAQQLPMDPPIAIDAVALEDNGLSLDDSVEFSLGHPAPIFSHLIAALDSVNLTIQLKQNFITITTHDKADENYPIRIYEVDVLVEQKLKLVIADEASLSARLGSTSPPFVETVQDRRSMQMYRLRESMVDELMALIECTIQQDSWESLGGNGLITPRFNADKPYLVIANSTLAHLEIDTLLNRLAGDRAYRPIPTVSSGDQSNDYRNASSRFGLKESPIQKRLTNFANPNDSSDNLVGNHVFRGIQE